MKVLPKTLSWLALTAAAAALLAACGQKPAFTQQTQPAPPDPSGAQDLPPAPLGSSHSPEKTSTAGAAKPAETSSVSGSAPSRGVGGAASGGKDQPRPTTRVPSSPLPSNPVATNPAPSDPVPTNPLPSAPVSNNPVPNNPLPTNPVPGSPTPNSPSPNYPVPNNPQPPGPGGPPTPPTPGPFALTWSFPCEQPQAATNDTTKLVGEGKHQLSVHGATDLAIKFDGTLCTPESKPRDIVFVIDVTGSMGHGHGPDYNHDLYRHGTCGRLDAINRVLATLPPDDIARVSVLTFNTDIEARSTRFFPDAQTLFADLENSNDGDYIGKIICAAGGDTDYSIALSGAADLFANYGRQGAQKEIYFVSDGEPNVGDGIAEAKGLRDNGVMIAALMLIGDETIMRDKIASRDAQGVPLFRKVSQAADLAGALAALSTNNLVHADLKIRQAGSSDWQRFDWQPNQTGYAFSMPAVTYHLQESPNLDVVIETLDAHGVTGQITGQLDTTN